MLNVLFSVLPPFGLAVTMMFSLMTIDVMSGYALAAYNCKVNSSMLGRGTMRKIMRVLIVCTAEILYLYLSQLHAGIVPLGVLAAGIMATVEVHSILENAKIMGLEEAAIIGKLIGPVLRCLDVSRKIENNTARGDVFDQVLNYHSDTRRKDDHGSEAPAVAPTSAE